VSADPDRFRGDPDGYLAWAEENYRPNPQWCARHWAPCPVEGRNGLAASIRLTQLTIEEMPDEVRKSPKLMNEWQEAQEEPTCCRLGDERMAEIWAEVPGP
jgi:hypothetical protein